MSDHARSIRRLFVANRGEIAARVIRTCRALGLRTVIGVSTVDRDSLPARMADRSVCIGPGPAARSYLDGDALLSAAINTGCDAIHPGYGFLAENPGFARACAEHGLIFVGPSPEVIARAGDKARARELAYSAGIPVLAGSPVLESVTDAVAAARELGYPVLIKAVAGGGGRGMSVAEDEQELRRRWAAASREAAAAFGDGRLYLERFIRRAAHIEVQVLGDRHGAMIHLGERDCTLQRRHQKVIEESPAPNLPEPVRAEIRDSAVAFGKAIGLDSAGTVEFIYDVDTQTYAFLEFNARIQVEHPVTELVTGVDLIEEQLRAAAGEPLRLRQDDITITGHAIEARVTAENPEQDFLPSPGTVTGWRPPSGPGIRVDTHCEPGHTVPPYYDSLLAKVIAHGQGRDEAADRLAGALEELHVSGVPTTAPFLRFVLTHPDFRAGKVTTQWIASHGLPGYLERRR